MEQDINTVIDEEFKKWTQESSATSSLLEIFEDSPLHELMVRNLRLAFHKGYALAQQETIEILTELKNK